MVAGFEIILVFFFFWTQPRHFDIPACARLAPEKSAMLVFSL